MEKFEYFIVEDDAVTCLPVTKTTNKESGKCKKSFTLKNVGFVYWYN